MATEQLYSGEISPAPELHQRIEMMVMLHII